MLNATDQTGSGWLSDLCSLKDLIFQICTKYSDEEAKKLPSLLKVTHKILPIGLYTFEIYSYESVLVNIIYPFS